VRVLAKNELQVDPHHRKSKIIRFIFPKGAEMAEPLKLLDFDLLIAIQFLEISSHLTIPE
jgi:hypothetical protein